MAHKNNKPGPLDGIKVVEYGIFHAGPCATAILGDLGADVIKIEAGVGDPERLWKKVAGFDLSLKNGSTFLVEVSNRNKKGIHLDIGTEKGREIFHALVKDSDVFLTNLLPETKKKLGIDYKSISKINPKIIHANVSGYGPEGPMKDAGAYDSMGQAYSGMMFAAGNDKPNLLRFGILDQATSISASHAIITALFARERQGKGQEIHVSLYSTALWLMHLNQMFAGLFNIDPCMPIERYEVSPLRNHFKCKDGKWVISTHHPENKYWPPFCRVTGKEEMLKDPEFTDDNGNPKNLKKMLPIFDEIMATKTRDEWMELFLENNLLFSPVKDILEVLKDPQAIENNYIEEFDHPDLGSINILGYPIHFSENSAGMKSPAPTIGQHTDEVMRELGYSDEDIKTLKADKVIK